METNNAKTKAGPDQLKPERLQELIRQLLVEIGEDPGREGLVDTPRRVAEAWRFFTQGYGQDVGSLLDNAIADDRHEGIVLVKDIDLYSLCEHHLVPFYGNCHIAYVPDKKIIGLSKIARVVDIFSRRLQVQERLTNQIADALETHLEPAGVAVQVEARHLCMTMRGVEKHNALVTTSAMRGRFKEDASLRSEFFAVLGNPRQA
ncbi:MAG: GTP cyclohydrolase I FolE [Candidatus Latescibacterota bacterium]|jgi:GTP cyclohydrolase I